MSFTMILNYGLLVGVVRGSLSKKPLTRVYTPAPEVHGKRGLERGWKRRLAKG